MGFFPKVSKRSIPCGFPRISMAGFWVDFPMASWNLWWPSIGLNGWLSIGWWFQISTLKMVGLNQNIHPLKEMVCPVAFQDFSWFFFVCLVRSIPSAWSSSIHPSRCASQMASLSQWQVRRRGSQPSVATKGGMVGFWRFFFGGEGGGLKQNCGFKALEIYLLFCFFLLFKPCSALFGFIFLLSWVEIIPGWFLQCTFHVALPDFFWASPFWKAFVVTATRGAFPQKEKVNPEGHKQEVWRG